MPAREARGICKHCGPVIAHQQRPNHILHLLLSAFTAGLWLPAWLLLSLMPKNWYCSRCGMAAKRKRSLI